MHTITNNYRDCSHLKPGFGRPKRPISRHSNRRVADRCVAKGEDVCPASGWAVGRFQCLRFEGQAGSHGRDCVITTTQIMETFGKLFGSPRVLALPVDEAGLKAWLERQKDGNPLEAARAWAAGYHERHRKKRSR